MFLTLRALAKFKRRKSTVVGKERGVKGELPEQCEALVGLSIEELRAKLEEAEEQSTRNRQTIFEVGERGQRLLNEEAALEAQLDGCQSSLVDTAVVEQLPSTIHGKHDELHLPTGPSGQKIYRQIVKQHIQLKRLKEEIIGLEENLVNNVDMLQEHLRITRHNFAAGFTGAMKFAAKLKKSKKTKENSMELEAEVDKKDSFFDDSLVKKGNDQTSHHAHVLSETVKEDTAMARKGAERRGQERAMMLRELLEVGRESSHMMATLQKQLEETKQRNSILQRELAQCRDSRHDLSHALFDSTALLQNELDDINHGAERAEVEILQAHSEFDSVHAGHRHAKKIAENRRSLAAKALLVPKLNIHAMATHSEASSEEDSDASSEIYFTGMANCASDRRAAQRVLPMMVSRSDMVSKNATRKKKDRTYGKRHGYKDDMEVVVHTEKKPEEKKPSQDSIKKEQVQANLTETSDVWDGVSWAAWTAAGVMGDVLLKIDEMTRAEEAEQTSTGKTRHRTRRG